MSQIIRILYVDDSLFDRELVRDALEKEHGGFDLTTVASRTAFEAAFAEGGFDLVLSDFNILGFEGLDVLQIVHAQNPDLPVIIVTGTGSEAIAVSALKQGAADYIIKTPDHIRRLPQAIHAVLEKRQVQAALKESQLRWEGIFGNTGLFFGHQHRVSVGYEEAFAENMRQAWVAVDQPVHATTLLLDGGKPATRA